MVNPEFRTFSIGTSMMPPRGLGAEDFNSLTSLSFACPSTMTHKCLGAEEVVSDAIAKNVDVISVISAGNYLQAIIDRIEREGLADKLRVVNLVNFPSGRGNVEMPIDPRRILRDASEREAYVREHLRDGSIVRDYTDFMPSSYLEMAALILGAVTKTGHSGYIGVGVGSGKFALSIIDAIKQCDLETKLIGIVPKGQNGIFTGDNLYKKDGKLFYKRFNPSTIADKLACPYTYFQKQLLAAQAEGHRFIEVTDEQLMEAYETAWFAGLRGEPSSSAGFVLTNQSFRETNGIPNNKPITLVHTGYGKGNSWWQHGHIRV